MINLIKKIRKILVPNRYKITGSEKKIDEFRYWLCQKLGSFQGKLERAKEAFLIARVVYNPTCVRWDYSSIFHILHHWLGRMEDVQRKDTLHLHSDRRADEIKLCILLLNRICKSDYEEMALKPHDDFWGEIHTWSTPSKDMPGYYQWNSARPNVKTPEQMKQERDEFRRAMKHADYLRNQDIELLFKTIRKHHGGWWT